MGAVATGATVVGVGAAQDANAIAIVAMLARLMVLLPLNFDIILILSFARFF